MRPKAEQGSVTVWLVTSAAAMVLLVGLAVDLGGQVHAQQRARAVAAQAARAGTQEVAGSEAMRGETLRLDTGAARLAAQRHLNDAGVQGDVDIVGGTSLRVRTRDTYTTKFLGTIGIGSLGVTGTATARLVRSEGGTER